LDLDRSALRSLFFAVMALFIAAGLQHSAVWQPAVSD
jgi:hypothetical protein